MNEASRRILADAFSAVPRVDISFECAIRGLAGGFFGEADTPSGAIMLQVPPFYYFAGDPQRGSASEELLCSVPPHCLIMPSAPGWFERALEVLGSDRLNRTERYSYSAEHVTKSHLESVLHTNRFALAVQPITRDLANEATRDSSHLIDLSHFVSGDDFTARGLGFQVSQKGIVIGAAYSSLAYDEAIEASVFVHPQHRRCGLATALCARLLLASLERGVRPNWDAANRISCRLGEHLGLRLSGTYEALVRLE